MLFGKKKKQEQAAAAEEVAPEAPAPPAPVAEEVAPPPPPAAPAPVPAAPAPVPAAPAPVPAAPAPAAEAPAPDGKTRLKPDYDNAATIPANHIIVNAGNNRVVLDIAREITDGGDSKLLPIESRVVMSAETAKRLRSALDQALNKLAQPS